MQTCEICGKQFRSLNLNHLRTHGVMDWDHYENMVAQRTRPDQNLLREVTQDLLYREQVSEEHARKLARINMGANTNIPNMVKVQKLRTNLRLIELMQKRETLTSLVFDEERLAEASLETLAKILQLMNADIDTSFKQLQEEIPDKGVIDAAGTVVNNTTYQFVQANGVGTQFDQELPEDPRAQAGLMQKVEDLLTQMRTGENPHVVETTGEVTDVNGHGTQQPVE